MQVAHLPEGRHLLLDVHCEIQNPELFNWSLAVAFVPHDTVICVPDLKIELQLYVTLAVDLEELFISRNEVIIDFVWSGTAAS